MVGNMDEGLPIAYPVLEDGVAVYSAEGTEVGTVDHVVAAPEQDIFHGLVIRTASGRRFVEADAVASLHERGVDLRIGVDQVQSLPEPHGAAPAHHVREPGAKPSRWRHMVDRLTGADSTRRDWAEED
jgi:sporulation protein YlmC with PRC-barrel domain